MVASAADFYKVYEEHSKTLRTWLVAYGVGVPVLVLSNQSLWADVVRANRLEQFASLFLSGVGMQVLLTAVNKHTMWAVYFGETDADFVSTKRYKFASWVSLQYWIDIVVDLATILTFAIGTWVLLSITVQQRVKNPETSAIEASTVNGSQATRKDTVRKK